MNQNNSRPNIRQRNPMKNCIACPLRRQAMVVDGFPVKTLMILFAFVLSLMSLSAQVSFGDPQKINQGWKFQKDDIENASLPGFDDSQWRQLDLPHDWSVEGPYSPHLASATGYLPGGIAWYRKNLEVPLAKKSAKVYIYFEGVYRNGELFVNGTYVGMRPNGYTSYMYDITPYIDFGKTNTLAMRVDHSKYIDSRWYTGSGIYRDVYLVYANPVHIDQWGVFYTTSLIKGGKAEVSVQSSVQNTTNQSAWVTAIHEILDNTGKSVTRNSRKVKVPAGSVEALTQNLRVNQPKLWSLESPYLYQLSTSLYSDGELIDHSVVNIGIRTLDFDANEGFALNGESINLKGVCLHHDAGSLGSAVPREVWERRLINLKSLGCNAIRTSHNPQAPVFYHLCDSLGLLVINEAFDEWEFPKKKWVKGWNVGTPELIGPAEFFEEWGEADLKSMILRDRNHPSVIMWSIGNEVDYPNDPYSHPILDEEGIQQQHTSGYLPDQPNAERLGDIAKRLAAVVREFDPSRPVTAGLAGPVMSNETEYPGALDVVGYNYTESRYEQDHKTYPERILYGSENGHSFEAWKAVRDNDYIFGQFLWTGIDYLGESHRWPSRGFTSGLLDLAGFKKPRGYFRESLWSNEPMIYLGTYPNTGSRWNPIIDAPSLWNYEEDDTINVVSYTNCEKAQLFLNGEKVGNEQEHDENTGVITWRVPFEPGKIEVIGYNADGEAARYSVETTQRPYAINAKVWDENLLKPDDVAQIEIQIVDEDGKFVWRSDNEITCETSGPVRLLGLEASDPSDMGNYNDNRQRVYHGTMIAYVQATEKGEATVTFTSPWLEKSVVELEIK